MYVQLSYRRRRPDADFESIRAYPSSRCPVLSTVFSSSRQSDFTRDVEIEEDTRREELFEPLCGWRSPIRLIMSPPRANDDRLLRSRSTTRVQSGRRIPLGPSVPRSGPHDRARKRELRMRELQELSRMISAAMKRSG